MKLLSNAILGYMSSQGVQVPKYDRSELSPGILHVGVGNFHRGHMAGT